jgi:excisionase family DNA binding protein
MTDMKQGASIPDLEGYISVKEAAKIIGVSPRRVHDYIDKGQLPARSVGNIRVLPIEEVQNFQPKPSGRQRSKAPEWYRYKRQGALLSTFVQVGIRAGMREKFLEKLATIKEAEHTFTKNVARYIMDDGKTITIQLIWKDTEMPDERIRQEDLRMFQQKFADELDWETAHYDSRSVLLHT